MTYLHTYTCIYMYIYIHKFKDVHGQCICINTQSKRGGRQTKKTKNRMLSI